MVAVIKDGYSIRNVLSYNENKVKEGVAECIAAVNYPKDLEWLSFKNKLHRLEHQAALRPRVERNHVHISLNFAPGEHFEADKLNQIADAYMRKMGMDDLPYLVYQHHDAGHPHIHIVTMKIRANGDKVEWNDIGKNESSTARREIEEEFGLVKADDHGGDEAFEIKAINVRKAQYGKVETKRAITNVLTEIFEGYQFSSFTEFNVLLSKYNVTADEGSKNSKTFKNRGLNYCILDDNGKKIGVPIKASKFYNKPTLKAIEKKWKENAKMRFKYREKLKTAIDKYFITATNPGFENFKRELAREKIDLVLNKNKDGKVSGMWFIDYANKSIFKGSDIDRGYSYSGIEAKLQKIGKEKLINQSITKTSKYQQGRSADIGKSNDYRSVKNPSLSVLSTFEKSIVKIPYARQNDLVSCAFHIATGWIHVTLEPIDSGYEQVPYVHMNGRYKKKRKKQGN